jgi:hypothetical protein
MNDTIRLRDVVQVELEQLEAYGEAASEFFHELSDDIKQEFTSSLETLLTHDLAAFQSQVNRSLGNAGLGDAGNVLGGVLGDTLGSLLPENMAGNVFGAAIGGALRTAARDLVRNGSLDVGRTIASANRYGGNRLDSIIRRGELPMSNSQRSAEAWNQLGRGQRNL